MNARSVLRAALLCTLLAAGSQAFGIGFTLGATTSLGQGFAYGSYLDGKTASIAEYGASAFGTPGTIRPDLFAAWSLGAFAEIELLDWLGLRVEPHFAFLGAAYVTSTAAITAPAAAPGVPFDLYGTYFGSILLPILAHARFQLGPGRFTATAGPILGFTVGGISMVDRYAASTTTAAFPYAAMQPVQFSICAGAGYEMALGPGVAALEVRTDIMLTSATSATGPVGGEIMTVPVYLAASYGFRLGGATQ
jgi:hypothetical protein